MGGDLDHSDFVDPDFDAAHATAGSAVVARPVRSGEAPTRPPSREQISEQVTSTQQALLELKQRQEELERERVQLEEAKRRRAEFEQGREEMLAHLTRGIGLLTEAEQGARRDAEQLARTLADLRAALEKVSALNEESWTADNYHTELTRALTTLENSRMEWNGAQMKWPVLVSHPSTAPIGGSDAATDRGTLLTGRTPGELARLGLALTWPVALAVLAAGLVLAVVLARR